MTPDEAVDRIASRLSDKLLSLKRTSDKRVWIDVPRESIPDTAELMFKELEARLQTASGMDAPKEMEILYHWALDKLQLIVTIRTFVDRQRPQIDSITPICPAAEWIEREMWELLGIHFDNHPDLRHLVLNDDWPEGKFPLRRDYKKD